MPIDETKVEATFELSRALVRFWGVILAASKCVPASWDSTMAETQAIMYGVQSAKEAGLSSLIVESDNLVSIKALNDGAADSPYHALCVENIIDRASSFL
ncbi:hypothetical protein GH714_008433 [Hevea brasiliensis]|uniref:RNase H type-1 domain-containing protein n=1 Tax=Hevea brasiliensis TaxID=3981 RepID=A0A6A6LF90_HEVBR|nr:hypothetical protein GH714_008433 [Hevea brasiliensis]